MEMLFGILAGVGVGYAAAMATKQDEFGKIVFICFRGAGAIATCLLWTFIADRNVGTSASIEWIIAGLVGGFGGVVFHRILTTVLYRIWPSGDKAHEHTGEHAGEHQKIKH